jgi:hypothetical protein
MIAELTRLRDRESRKAPRGAYQAAHDRLKRLPIGWRRLTAAPGTTRLCQLDALPGKRHCRSVPRPHRPKPRCLLAPL